MMTTTAGWSPTGSGEREPDPAAERRAEEHLPLAADVEEAGAEGQADAESGRDERRREGERLGERPDALREVGPAEVVDRALEERGVCTGDGVPDRGEHVAGAGEEVGRCGDHVLVGRRDEDRADEECEDDGDDADEDLPKRISWNALRQRSRWTSSGVCGAAPGATVPGVPAGELMRRPLRASRRPS